MFFFGALGSFSFFSLVVFSFLGAFSLTALGMAELGCRRERGRARSRGQQGVGGGQRGTRQRRQHRQPGRRRPSTHLLT